MSWHGAALCSSQRTTEDANNVKSCLKLPNEVGEDVPRFVSYHLDDLPPVTFNSLDVSCLVSRIERLSAVISSMML